MARRKTVEVDPDDGPNVYEVGGDNEVPQGRTRTVRTIIDEEQPVEGSQAQGDAEPVNPIDSLLEELDGGTEFDIAVFRVDKSKPNGRVFCGPLAAGGLENSSILCSRLQQEYGGGSFYLQFRKSGGGKAPFLKRVIVTVEAPKTVPVPAVDTNQLAAAITAAMAPMQTALAQVAQAQQRPGFDFNALLSHPLAALVIPALVQRVLGGGGGDGKFDLDAYLTMKAKMDQAGFGDGEPNTLTQVAGLLKDYGKPLMDLAQQQANQQAINGPRAVAPGARPQAAPGTLPFSPMGIVPGIGPMNPAAATVPGKATSTAIPLNQLVSPLVPSIVGLAQAGVGADVAAEKIVELLPEDFIDPVCDAIESGELVAILTKHPQLSGYTVWLQQVGDAMLALMDDGEDTPESGGEIEPEPEVLTGE